MATKETALTEETTALALTEEPTQIEQAPGWTVRDVMDAVPGVAASVLLKSKGTGNTTEMQATVALLMLTARDLGLPPVAALPQMHVISGNVSLSPHLMLGLIQKHGGAIGATVEIDSTDEQCTVTMTRPGGVVGKQVVQWTMADAEKAGLKKNANWQKHPRQMLRVRAIGECARIVWPDVVCGTYVQGEIEEGAFRKPAKEEEPSPGYTREVSVERAEEIGALATRASKVLKGEDYEKLQGWMADLGSKHSKWTTAEADKFEKDAEKLVAAAETSSGEGTE